MVSIQKSIMMRSKATGLLHSVTKCLISSTRQLQQKAVPQESGLLHELAKNEQIVNDHNSVVDYFLKNKLYEDEMIIAFNKPYGYSVKVENPSGIVFSPSNSLIHALRHIYKLPNLTVALPLNKDQSGVIIFAKDFDGKNAFYKNYVTLKSERICPHHYKKGGFNNDVSLTTHCRESVKEESLFNLPTLKGRAVCLGIPKGLQSYPEDNFLKSVLINEKNEMVPVEHGNKKARKKGTIQFYSMLGEIRSQNVLDTNSSTSFVSLSTNTVQRDACKIFMTKKLAPIIGDHVYGGRVVMIQGHPVYVNPERAVHGQQRIPANILGHLGVPESQSKAFPLHLHRAAVDIIQLPFKKNQRHTITAPLSDFFRFTLDKLSLCEEDSQRLCIDYPSL